MKIIFDKAENDKIDIENIRDTHYVGYISNLSGIFMLAFCLNGKYLFLNTRTWKHSVETDSVNMMGAISEIMRRYPTQQNFHAFKSAKEAFDFAIKCLENARTRN